MAIYDSRDFEEMDLADRFPRREDIAGVEQWVRLIAGIRDQMSRAETIEGTVAIFREFDQFLQTVPAQCWRLRIDLQSPHRLRPS